MRHPAVVVVLLLFLSALAAATGSCSLGPALPMGVPVVNVTCNWQVMDAGTCTNCICVIYHPTATSTPTTNGVETGDVELLNDLALLLARGAPIDGGVDGGLDGGVDAGGAVVGLDGG
jgi:hypothetical protein